MIIWQGWGLLVIAIAAATFIAVQLVVDGTGGEGTYQASTWPAFLGFVLSGAGVWYLGDYLDKKPGKVLLDPQTGEQVMLKDQHSLFFVPMKWWGIVLGAGGFLYVAAEWMK